MNKFFAEDFIVSVNNVPKYANDYEYIVARFIDGELWFWGAYGIESAAEEAAEEVNGIVLRSNNNG